MCALSVGRRLWNHPVPGGASTTKTNKTSSKRFLAAMVTAFGYIELNKESLDTMIDHIVV